MVTAVGLCRARMAAAMIKKGKVPKLFEGYGKAVEEADLRAIYGKGAGGFSPGAIGVFPYLNKIGFGVRHFAALNRKFNVDLFDRKDLIPLTPAAAQLLNG